MGQHISLMVTEEAFAFLERRAMECRGVGVLVPEDVVRALIDEAMGSREELERRIERLEGMVRDLGR